MLSEKKNIAASKRRWTSELRDLSFSEKVAMLEKLRERELLLAEVREKLASSRESQPRKKTR